MEYFAKSPAFVLSKEKQDDISKRISALLMELKDEFSESETEKLKQYIRDIGKTDVYEHKKLHDHLEDTVSCAKKFFNIYGDQFTEKEKQLILFTCQEHDVGKANYIFQTMVNPKLKKEKTPQIPHGFLSAISLSEKDFLNKIKGSTKSDFCVTLTAIYYHHTRQDDFDSKTFKDYCDRYYTEYLKEFKENKEASLYIRNRNNLLFSNDFGKSSWHASEEEWCEYMLIKGLLNKFDWTVSAGYEEAEISTDRYNKSLCQNILNKKVQQLRPAQRFMKVNKDNNLIVTAPTGSGKTEAALLWLDGEKGFYTLPLKVSSNAIYQRIRENYCFTDTALLHSDSMNIYLQEEENFGDGYKKYEQAKLFSYPLTVCTVDQLFKFVYKALGTEIYAATLKYSKIIIDEIQSYSPEVVAALIYGLSEIKNMGGRFAIITATFPPVLSYFLKECGLLEKRDYLFKDFSNVEDAGRHRIKVIDGEFDVDEIISNADEKKILIICNTVSNAQDLYKKIAKKYHNVNLLHARFIRKHREILENKIMQFSQDENAVGIWITTQIVEASLDIDFDLLYTEMCTADALLQRMGRCNRAGKKSTEFPNIFVFNIDSECKKQGTYEIYDREIYKRSIDCLRKYNGKLFLEKDKISYIDEVYDTEQIRDTAYFKKIEENIKYFKNLSPLECDKEKADKRFRAINSITVMPENIYNDNIKMIQHVMELLEVPNIKPSIRKILKTKVASLTMGINIYNGIPNGVDQSVMLPLDIHRANLLYDFDEPEGRGMGLVFEKTEENASFV